MVRARVAALGALLLVGATPVAATAAVAAPLHRAQQPCNEPVLSVVMAQGEVLQIGFTDLGPEDQLREVRLHTTPAEQALAEPDNGVIWQVRSSSALGVNPVVVKVPDAPAGMTVPVPLDQPLPDTVTVVVQLLDADSRPINLTKEVDVAGLRAAPPGNAELDVGCGDEPGSELGSIMKSIAIGAVLFILGVSALLLVINILLLGLRRVIFGSAR